MPVRPCPVALAVALALPVVAPATGEEAPEAAFIEYLGSWETADSDWRLFEDAAGDQSVEEKDRGDSEPDGDESREQNDES